MQHHHLLRQLTAILTAVLLALMAGTPWVTRAVDDTKQLYGDYLYYTISSDGQAIILDARASIRTADIPQEIDGCPVTAIEAYAFKDCTHLTQVTIPDTVQRIGEFAFQNCTRLTSLSIPDTVSEIGWGIVQETPWLAQQDTDFVVAGAQILLAYCGDDQAVTVPAGVRTIGGFAFSGCNTIQTVTLPDSVTAIDAFAFDQCQSLRQITFPSQLTTIGAYAFHWCIALEQAFLPDSVQSLGNHAFGYCKSLKQVQLSSGMKQIANMTFYGCTSLTTLTIPEGITQIGNSAFRDCTGLTAITLPQTLGTLDNGVFAGCAGLQQVRILNAQCQICDDAATLSTAEIHGMLISTASRYAEKYQHSFYALDYLRGDFDENQKITIFDAYLVLIQYALAAAGTPGNLTQAQQYTADYNGDGVIDITDAYQILLHYANEAAGNTPAP